MPNQNPMEFAARVGDPIQHTKTFIWGVIGGIAAGLLVAAVIVFPPTALLEAAGFACAGAGGLGALATWGSVSAVAAGVSFGKTLGEDSGSHFNYIAGDIKEGSPTIAIGRGQPRAARMSSTLRCHDGNKVATGSICVFYDKPLWNASRKMLDYTDCGGQIEDGCHTVNVGGESIARPGAKIKEKASLTYRLIFLGIDALGTYGSFAASPLRWASMADKFVSGGKILSAVTKTYKATSDNITALPYAKEVDAIGGLAAKGPGFARDLGTLRSANDVAKNAKLLSDLGGGGAKLGSYTNPSAPHIPSYGGGHP
jgi:hypothetical protein